MTHSQESQVNLSRTRGLKKPSSTEIRDAVKQFREANPDVKDIDKILAGAKLNVPQDLADDRRLNEFGKAVDKATTDQDTSSSLYDQVGIARMFRDTPISGQKPGQDAVSPVGERFNKLMNRNDMPHIQTRVSTASLGQDGDLTDFSFGATNTNTNRALTFSGGLGENE